METQIFELYSLFGNGVLSGWEISPQSNSNIIFITPGTGHVGYKSSATINNFQVELSPPPDLSIPERGVKFYIYGNETDDTAIDRSIDFFASTNVLTYQNYNAQSISGISLNPGGLIRIGEIVLKTTPSGGYTLDDPTYETRDNISLFGNLSNYIRNHVHIGGANNPAKINLYRHVTGKLSGDFIDWLDASLITKGKISSDRLPTFSHEELADIGSLSHFDIDNIILSWSLNTDHYLNDVAMSNELKIVMLLKHVFETFDETLTNIIAYIPGLTTTEWEDSENTTALIDRDNHIIYGYLASPAGSNFISWNTKNEFDLAVSEYNVDISDYADIDDNPFDKVVRSSGITTFTDGIKLQKQLNFEIIHQDNDDVDWIQVPKILDNGSFGKNSDFGVDVDFAHFMFKLFEAPGTSTLLSQDWTGSTKLQFSFKLENEDDLDHGDIYFFLIDAPPDDSGDAEVQFETIEYTRNGRKDKIIANTGIRIIESGTLTDGFKFIDLDLNQFNGLDSVSGIGFYTTTSSGWNPSVKFEWQVDQPDYSDMSDSVELYLKENDPTKIISIYIYNDNIYSSTGFIKFRFNTPTLSFWDYISIEKDIPDYDGSGSQPSINLSTKVAAGEDGLFTASAKSAQATIDEDLYTIGQSESYWIEITASLVASGDRLITPVLYELNLYYTTSSESNSKTWAEYSTWFDYSRIININIAQNPDRIELSSYDNVETRYFIDQNLIKTINQQEDEVSDLTFDGSNLPKTPIQVFFKMGSGFIQPSQVSRTEEGNYLIADSGNDRIIDMNSDGSINKIIQGNSYLGLIQRDLMALTSTYNERLGQVAITFSQAIPLTSLNLEKFVLMSESGVNKINLGNTDFATPKMIGTALQGNLLTLDGAEWSVPSSTDSFDIGSETQSGSTIIPGIGKTGPGTAISDNLGAILIFTLTDAVNAQVSSWSGEKRIMVGAEAFLGGGTGGINTSTLSPGNIEPSTATALWFDAEDDNRSDIDNPTEGQESKSSVFSKNYNPFVSEDAIADDYDIPELQKEDVDLNISNNIYSKLPFISYIENNKTFYLSEPRYNLPLILVRYNPSYEYDVEDKNQFYSDLYLSYSNWLKLIDYDENGDVNQTILKDPQNNISNLELSIDEIDIIYYDVLHPVSVYKTSDGQYIFAQTNRHSIVNLNVEGIASWSVLDSTVNYSFGDFGSARETDDGNIFVVSPTMNMIGEYIVSNQSVVNNIYTKYGPIDALNESDGILILTSQKTSFGQNSRACNRKYKLGIWIGETQAAYGHKEDF